MSKWERPRMMSTSRRRQANGKIVAQVDLFLGTNIYQTKFLMKQKTADVTACESPCMRSSERLANESEVKATQPARQEGNGESSTSKSNIIISSSTLVLVDMEDEVDEVVSQGDEVKRRASASSVAELAVV